MPSPERTSPKALPRSRAACRTRAKVCAALVACLLAACAAAPTTPTARVWLFGEQHDQPDQQAQVAAEVKRLAASGELAALVIEMAEAPYSTVALPRDADAAQVRQALHWSGWRWHTYQAVVMNAVSAGVPVFGGNLSTSALHSAMSDAGLDRTIDAAAAARLAEAVHEGHCGLLPVSQEPGMVRVQIARDRSMAKVVAAALHDARPGQRVLLLAGAMHVLRDRGVPLHLQSDAGLAASDIHVVVFGTAGGAPSAGADEQRLTAHTPRPDPCEALRQRLQAPAAGASAAQP